MASYENNLKLMGKHEESWFSRSVKPRRFWKANPRMPSHKPRKLWK